MSLKFKASRSQVRLLIYLVVSGVVAAGYWFRDSAVHSPSGTLDPAALPENLAGEFEVINGSRIVPDPGNDGDSFRVRHLGEEYTFRLYFVDCPETSDRYPDRLRHQADYFGGLSPDQTVAIGQEAREFTLELLKNRPFAILTRWENVMKSYRYHAFVLVETSPNKTEYLSEILVRKGLARIYTLGAALPDGTTRKEFENHLKALEREAKSSRAGAWRF